MATGATTNFQIPLFGDTDFVTPIQTPLNAQSNALDAALTKAGFIPYPTLAALNAAPGTVVGQHASVNADTTAANNRDYAWSGTAWVGLPQGPYAVAQGSFNIATSVNNGANTTLAITFPTNRFTQPPFVLVMPGNARFTPGVSGITAAGANVSLANWSTGGGAPGLCTWLAVQMLAGNAAG